MGNTQVRGNQLKDGDITRDDLNVTTVGKAVVRKIIGGTGISLSSTGADAGTGDVTINLSGATSSPWTRSGSYIYPTTITDRVGIGVTSPQTSLHIAGVDGKLATWPDNLGGSDAVVIDNNGNSAISIFGPNTSSGALKFYDPDGSFWRGIILYDHPTDALSFGTSGLRNMYLNDVGFLSIGLDDAETNLHVKGDYEAATSAGNFYCTALVEGNTGQHTGLTISSPDSSHVAGLSLTNQTNGYGWAISSRHSLEAPYNRLTFSHYEGSWYEPIYFEKRNITITPGGNLRITGLQSGSSYDSPTSGQGLELYHQNGVSYIISYDRSTPAWKPFYLYGSELYWNNGSQPHKIDGVHGVAFNFGDGNNAVAAGATQVTDIPYNCNAYYWAMHTETGWQDLYIETIASGSYPSGTWTTIAYCLSGGTAFTSGTINVNLTAGYVLRARVLTPGGVKTMSVTLRVRKT